MILDSKVALITGGASGIGAAIAQRFVKEGASVAVCDIDAKTGADTALKLGDKARFYRLDIADEEEVRKTVEDIQNHYTKIDILINNAGIANDKLILRMTKDDWEQVLDINLTGTFLVTKTVIRYMVKQRYGKIVNITSVIGIIGNPGQANYAASKAGVIGFTKSVAKELAARNITANAIAPGFIETKMTESIPEAVRQAYLKMIPAGRFGKTDDVANLALFLSSDQSSYITGQILCLSGGMVM